MANTPEFNVKKYLRLVYQKRYNFVAVMMLVTSVVVVFGYTMPKKYEAISTVLIERNFLNSIMKGIGVTPSIDDTVRAVSVTMKSRQLVLKVLKELNLVQKLKTEVEVEMLVKDFQMDTDIKSRREMELFTVSLKHSDPVIARDYVNMLIRQYIGESMSSQMEGTSGANKFLVGQIDLFKGKINKIEDEIARMSKGKDVAPQARLQVLQKKLDDLLTQYTESHPEVVKAKDEIQWQKEQMQDENTGGRNDTGTGNPSQSGKSGKIAALERDRETYRKIYGELLNALGKSEVSTHLEFQDKGAGLKIIEPAMLPLKPTTPGRVRMILLGLIAGIAAGIGSIILLDSMDKSVKNVDALKAFGLPILAVIPHIPDADEEAAIKQKDKILYSGTAFYYVCIVGMLLFEMFGRRLQ